MTTNQRRISITRNGKEKTKVRLKQENVTQLLQSAADCKDGVLDSLHSIEANTRILANAARLNPRLTSMNRPVPPDASAANLSPRKSITPSSHTTSSESLVHTNPYRRASFGKECSQLCRHGKPVKTQQEIQKEEKKKTKDSVLSLLKVQLKEKKDSLEDAKRRYLKLIKDNFELKKEIDLLDENTDTDAKKLLQQYERYKSGLHVMKRIHEKDMTDEEASLDRIQKRFDVFIKVLKDEIAGLDERIIEQKKELSVLLNYKEKEYPDKIEQIKILKYEVRKLEKQFALEIEEIDEIAELERTAYLSGLSQQEDLRITQQAEVESTRDGTALLSVDGITRLMAQRNTLLRREIAFHQNEVQLHENEIAVLEADIRKKELHKTLTSKIRNLMSDEEIRWLERKHPENFRERCIDDTEFELQIPKQRWLPI